MVHPERALSIALKRSARQINGDIHVAIVYQILVVIYAPRLLRNISPLIKEAYGRLKNESNIGT